jgi:hypothetical protein
VTRVVVPVRLALVRLRAHAARSLLAAAGIAVAAAVLSLTAVTAAAVQDRAVQRALAALAPSDRALQATWSGVPAQSTLSQAALDRNARAALHDVVPQSAFRVAVFREANWGGAYVSLGAVDGLARWVTLRSGRLPRGCTAVSCELLQVGGTRLARPKLPYLHVVGRAVFRPGAPLRDYLEASGKHAPVLVGSGVAGFLHVPLPFAPLIARSYGWIVPLGPGAVHPWSVASFQRRVDAAQSRLEERSDIFSVSGPTGTLADVNATSRVAARRLLVIGGDAAALLLGFAVLVAARLRRDHDALRRRLLRLGAGAGQRTGVTAFEVAVLTLVGTLGGWAAGAGGGALLARHLGAPGGASVAHSLLTGTGLALAGGLVLATAAVVLAALVGRGLAVAGLRFTVADALALGALAAILLALARGKADASTLAAQSGTGVLLLLLPGLTVIVLVVVAARLLAPALRLLERAARRGPVAARVALLSLARAPGQATLAAVFFVLAVGVAVFAVSYRATLLTGERQQASYAVPAALVLDEDLTKLVTLQQAAPPAVAARLGSATPVLRDSGFVTGGGGHDFTLLALPADALARIGGWRSDFSSRSPAQLAALIRPAGSTRLPGIQLPVAARELELPVTINGDRVGLSLTVLDRRGDFTSILLGEHQRGAHVLGHAIPPAARGGRLIALRITLPLLAAFAADHRDSGTSLAVSDNSHGSLVLGSLHADGVALPDWPGWNGTNGLARTGSRLDYIVNRAADSVFRPREPLEGEPIPVVATPSVARAAGPDGDIPLHVDETTVLGHVVAVARHVPSTDGEAVVADLGAWQAGLTAADAGLGAPTELWVDGLRPGAARLLGQAPFSSLLASQRAVAYAQLRNDPLARGTLDVLLIAAAVGLVLAGIGVLLGVVGDLRDESGELFDLEAQGASPTDVRRHLLLRAASVAGIGGAGGLAAGAIVGALVVSVVTVTAGATQPLPPLQHVSDWPLVLLALVVLGAVSAPVVYTVARGAFAAAGRRRFSEGLE